MRGQLVPSFYTDMTFKDKVSDLLNAALLERPSLFLIDLSISEAHKITVTIDGDQGVTLQDCIDVSRAIEHNLDREEVDFSLEVASAGVSAPLKLLRQFQKNIGRDLKVKTAAATFEGTLKGVDDAGIVLEWQAREPKKIGKGKETVVKQEQIPLADIKEAIVTIKF